MGNVVLTGGSSLFAGLSERLANELARNFAHVRTHSVLRFSSPFSTSTPPLLSPLMMPSIVLDVTFRHLWPSLLTRAHNF